MVSFETLPATVREKRLTRLRSASIVSEFAPIVVRPKVAVGVCVQPGSAEQIFSLPPVRIVLESDEILSTFWRMAALRAAGAMSWRERTSAAAPATCGDAIELPLTYP